MIYGVMFMSRQLSELSFICMKIENIDLDLFFLQRECGWTALLFHCIFDIVHCTFDLLWRSTIILLSSHPMLFSQCRTICLSYYQHSSHHRPLLYSKHLLILLFSHSLLSYFTSLDNTSDQDRAGAKRMHFPADHKSLFACSGSKVRRISILLNTRNEEEFLIFLQ